MGTPVLVSEQAALRRVATLVARGVAPEDVFASVTEEIGRLLAVEYAEMGRYEPDGTLVVVGAWGSDGNHLPVGSRWNVDGENLVAIVFNTGRPARIDGYADASGELGIAARAKGVREAVATPITVEGHLWGVAIAGSRGERPLPADTEVRLAEFTELVATAIGNAESRARLVRLAEEQSALRRVATLVAGGTPPESCSQRSPRRSGSCLTLSTPIWGATSLAGRSPSSHPGGRQASRFRQAAVGASGETTS
jgi:GAF domain-containing protein